MKISKYVAILFVFNLLISCSKSNDCFISDSIVKIKEYNADNIIFHLYLRISGLNKKEYFYELYDEKPEFDDCGKTTTKLLSDIHVDDSEGNPVKLIIRDKKIILLFSKNGTNIVDLKKIPVEIEKR